MNNEQKRKLLELKQAQQEKQKALRLKAEMARIRAEVAGFDEKYRFANEAEKSKINAFHTGLEYSLPAHIDLSGFEWKKRFEYAPSADLRVWICFLCGSEELFEIYVLAELKDFINDYDDWDFISPYMLLVYESFDGFIYVDDNGNMTEVREIGFIEQTFCIDNKG